MAEEKYKDLPTGLYWKGKKTEVDRVVLPFQTIEIINESRATRQREKDKGKELFGTNQQNDTWYNCLIWGDNKYIMASLFEEFAGKIDLIYIDPPFATGADFSVKMTLGDAEWTKEPSAIEDKAYRDTWGQGLDSYIQMMYERLVLMRELLSDTGSIYVHLDWHVSHYIKLILDDIFDIDNFRNEIIWYYSTLGRPKDKFAHKHKAKRTQKQTIIHLDQRLPEVTGRNPYSIPVKHLLPDNKGGYIEKDERRPSKTLLANQIREEVNKWRENGYKHPGGISDTSRRLMAWWFDETHFFTNSEIFQYYFAQREAIETIIYLYEVVKKRDAADLIFKYMDSKAYGDDLFTTRKKIEETTRQRRMLTRVVPETGLIAHQEIPAPDHYRYAIKMATGSGKTMVMAMAVVWSYFHKKFETNSILSKAFLIIAPNVIVFERLKQDFESGKIFQEWDLIPSEWKHHWQMTYILRGESRKTSTEGTLYLTNIHQLYKPRNNNDYDNPVNRLLGPKPKEATGSWEEHLLDRIKAHDDLLIINDEAHHVHDEDLEWMQVILRLHNHLKDKGSKGISIQLDFTATPKDQNGTFFPWIICDYPLAQAIEDRIVKAPLIVHQTDKIDPEKYDRASVAYAEWISIAISRWKDHHKAYGKVKKKPVLFIMAENTKDADDIYASLKTRAEFKGDE